MKICSGWENTKREAVLTRYMIAALSTPQWLVPLHSFLGELYQGCTKSFLETRKVSKRGVNHLSLPCRSSGSWYLEGTQMFILWKSATHTLNVNIMFFKLMVARGEGWREGIVWEFGMDMYTLLYLKWRTNKDPL